MVTNQYGQKQFWISKKRYFEVTETEKSYFVFRGHFISDSKHRKLGPFTTNIYGGKFWCYLDDIHRNDGPAFITSDGAIQWWFKDRQIKEETYWNK